MATTIKLKNSVTTTNAPSSLVQGEVAINITDKKVWVGNAATTPIQLLGAGASGTFGALTCTSLTNSGLTSGRVTYAGTGGLLQDDADFTFNGTTVTMANDASISGLTVGKGGGANGFSTAVGQSALNATNTQDNAAFGFAAMYNNTSGGANSAFGSYNALYSNTTGNYNCAFGRAALQSNTTGSSNIAVGMQALQANTTASFNTAIGFQAGLDNTTGANMVSVGAYALTNNTTGASNTGVGVSSLGLNTTGNYNVALGESALGSNTTASNNIAVGYQAGYSNTTGTGNLYVGYQVGYNTTTGSRNTFVGAFNIGVGSAGAQVTTGSANTVIGAYNGNQGGLDISTLSNRIVISDGDGNPRIYVNDGGEVIVGGVTDQGAYNLQCNGTGVWGAGAYVNGSDERIKDNITPLDSGLDVIAKLNPVTYKYKETWSKDQSTQTGFIAQELLTALDGKDYADGVVQQGGSQGYYSVAYQNIIPILTKAIQELKAEVDSLKAQLNK